MAIFVIIKIEPKKINENGHYLFICLPHISLVVPSIHLTYKASMQHNWNEHEMAECVKKCEIQKKYLLHAKPFNFAKMKNIKNSSRQNKVWYMKLILTRGFFDIFYFGEVKSFFVTGLKIQNRHFWVS